MYTLSYHIKGNIISAKQYDNTIRVVSLGLGISTVGQTVDGRAHRRKDCIIDAPQRSRRSAQSSESPRTAAPSIADGHERTATHCLRLVWIDLDATTIVVAFCEGHR